MTAWRFGRRVLGVVAGILWLATASGAPLQYAQLPVAVQKGIAAQLGNGKLGAIDRDVEDGDVTFTFEVTQSGRTLDYTVNETGALVSVEVDLAETPPPVQKSIRSQVGQGTLEGIDKTFDEGTVTYEVEWKTKDGHDRSFSVLEDGRLDSVEVALAETPSAVQVTIAGELGKGRLKEISRSFEDNAAFYDVTVNHDGVDREISVAENGRLESRQVFIAETPPAVQNTIKQHIGDARIAWIDHVFEKKKGSATFDVEGVKDGKRFYFSVGPKGAFLGME